LTHYHHHHPQGLLCLLFQRHLHRHYRRLLHHQFLLFQMDI
jgi:hypothetical protein